MKNISRTVITIAIAALCALATTAANRVYIKDFAINPGETKIVEIYVESITDIRSFQADIVLPEGLTMDYSKIAFSSRNNNHIIYADSTAQNTYTIVAFSLNNATFNGTDGTMAEVPITASDSFSRSATIMLNDITIEAADRTVLLHDGKQQCNAFIAQPQPAQAPDNAPANHTGHLNPTEES